MPVRDSNNSNNSMLCKMCQSKAVMSDSILVLLQYISL